MELCRIIGYLITLLFSSLSLLIITLMIINWNKSMLFLFNITSMTKYSTSTITVHFSTHLGSITIK
jgi:hypothetical protein